MSTHVTRRDILKLAGGSMLGMMFTPVPWKLLDDSSIWTQNWSLTPEVPRGPITFKYSACTLCPGGCAVKARCVGGIPVSVSGVPNHPITHGILCPLGLAGHTMPYHPLRVSQPQRFTSRSGDGVLTPVSFDDAMAEIMAATKNNDGAMAILDRNPGRVISEFYQRVGNAVPNAEYLTSAASEDATLSTLHEMCESSDMYVGFDFCNVKTVLSFGAPLLDGWGTPGQVIPLFNKRSESGLKLIQVESRQSRTALQADRWLPIKVGTEGILALGLANVILSENLAPKDIKDLARDFTSYREIVGKFSPDTVSTLTGISREQIVATVHALANSGPSIAIAGVNPGGGPPDKKSRIAVAGLNLLLGNVGLTGGIFPRRETQAGSARLSTHIEDMPDHSIRLLIIDEADAGYALPWSLVERKLIPDKNLVVSLSPFVCGLTAHADIIIPGPAHYESLRDVYSPSNSGATTFAFSTPLFQKKEGTVEPYEFLKKFMSSKGSVGFDNTSYEDVLKTRVESIYAGKRGSLFSPIDATTSPIVNIGSSDEFLTNLLEGAIWIDDTSSRKFSTRFALTGKDGELKGIELKPVLHEGELAILPCGWRGAVSSSVAPIMSKLFQESNLRSVAGNAFFNPETATSRGLVTGDKVVLTTDSGTMEVQVVIDPSVQPNLIEVAVGPLPNGSGIADQFSSHDVLALSSVNNDGTWRFTKVSITKV